MKLKKHIFFYKLSYECSNALNVAITNDCKGRQGRGEGMQTSGSAKWKWLVLNKPQQCRCCILSPLSVPDASWLLLLLECPGGWQVARQLRVVNILSHVCTNCQTTVVILSSCQVH